jgi:hypothetical protein
MKSQHNEQNDRLQTDMLCPSCVKKKRKWAERIIIQEKKNRADLTTTETSWFLNVLTCNYGRQLTTLLQQDTHALLTSRERGHVH